MEGGYSSAHTAHLYETLPNNYANANSIESKMGVHYETHSFINLNTSLDTDNEMNTNYSLCQIML